MRRRLTWISIAGVLLAGCSAGTVRSPSGPVSTTVAPSAIITGAVSEEETATHRGLQGATRQTSPSRFMQKPMARRHS